MYSLKCEDDTNSLMYSLKCEDDINSLMYSLKCEDNTNSLYIMMYSSYVKLILIAWCIV